MELAIDIQGVNFSYARAPLFQNLHLSVPRKVVFGLLGPNGAGKTSLMKLITGLLRPDAGNIGVFGAQWPDQRDQILRRTGALIGQAPMYGNLSATDNLRINARWYGAGKARIQETLQLTGLDGAGRKQVKHFSTGMKQRLGLALAMLHHPDLLILDEPLNGLDPVMRNEFRHIIAEAGKAGKTVLISSHELGEIEKSCSHVAVLDRGRCVFQGPIHTLLENQDRTVFIRCSNPARLREIAAGMGLSVNYDASILVPGDQSFAALMRRLVEADIAILGVETKMSGLDHFFKNTAL